MKFRRLVLLLCVSFAYEIAVCDVLVKADHEESKNHAVVSSHHSLLLAHLSEMLEIDFLLPANLIHFDLKTNDEEEELVNAFDAIFKKIKKNEDSLNSEDILCMLEESLAPVLLELDQFEKHEIVLMLCSKFIVQNNDKVVSIHDSRFLESILSLFPDADQPKVARLVRQLDQDVDTIGKIASIKYEGSRLEKIDECFPENRRKGAAIQIEGIISMNQIIKDLENLKANLNNLAIKSD